MNSSDCDIIAFDTFLSYSVNTITAVVINFSVYKNISVVCYSNFKQSVLFFAK